MSDTTTDDGEKADDEYRALRPTLHTREDVVLFGEFPIGQIEADDAGREVVVLNLGWCRLARVGLRVEGDPRKDRQRDGIVLERLVVVEPAF